MFEPSTAPLIPHDPDDVPARALSALEAVLVAELLAADGWVPASAAA